MKEHYSTNLCTFYVLASGVCWGCISLFIKPLQAMGVSNMQIVFIRSFIAAAVFTVMALISDKKALKIHFKDIWIFIGSGMLSVTVFNLCYFNAMSMMSVSTAAILLYTSPVFVTLMCAIFFKEKLTIQKICAMLLAVAGCALVAGFSSEGITPVAVLIGLGAALGYALYSIFGKLALDKYKPLTVTAYTFIFATGSSIFCADFYQLKISIKSTEFDLLAIGLAVVSTILPYLLYTAGLMGVKPSNAAIMASVEPVVATIISIFVWKQSPTPLTFIGIILVLAAIVLLNIKLEKRHANTDIH